MEHRSKDVPAKQMLRIIPKIFISILTNHTPKNEVRTIGLRYVRTIRPRYPSTPRADWQNYDDKLSKQLVQELDSLDLEYTDYDDTEEHTNKKNLRPEDLVINEDDPRSKAEFSQFMKGQRKFIKKKILEKKLRGSAHLNLLTWKAKLQLKYLNVQDSEEWTVKKLAEIFPVSREGVIQILRSKRLFKGTSEITKHDDIARKRWRAIKKGKFENETQLQFLIENNRLEVLKNAAGLLGVEIPIDFQELFIKIELTDDPTRQIGPFESIVHDHVKKVEHRKITSGEKISENRNNSIMEEKDRKYLESVANRLSAMLSVDADDNMISGRSKTHSIRGEQSIQHFSNDGEHSVESGRDGRRCVKVNSDSSYPNTLRPAVKRKGKKYFDRDDNFLFEVS